ncbi:MAG: hypothetical protein C4516_09050 [Oxalobacter sp.]|nr:MAG: hypothetical protein C4516_09050 [Oxalobacter sp.]
MNEPKTVSEKWTPLMALAKRFGESLLFRVALQAKNNGHSPLEVAQILGIPLNYFYHLYAGVSDVSRCRRETYEAFSRYLGEPVISVLCSAGVIRFDDLFTEDGLEDAIEEVNAELLEGVSDQPLLVQGFAGWLAGAVVPDTSLLVQMVASDSDDEVKVR